MSKKIFKISGTVFAILAFIILFFPWVYAYCEGKLVSADMTTNGFGLTEFSAWGTVISILPIMLLGVVFSKLGEKTKTVFLLGLYLLGSISFYYATSIGIQALREVSTEYVKLKAWLFLYPLFMFLSLLSFYLSYNTNDRSLLNLIGIESCDETDVDIGGLYLCSRPYTFGKVKEGEGFRSFPGCVSFVTEDGYFAALGHDEDYSCLKNGCIEMFDGDDTAGFVMQMRTSGIYGSFYDGHKFSTNTKMSIAPFDSIESDNAQLWLPGEDGFVKKAVEIKLDNSAYIICRILDDEKLNTNVEGAVIVQNGKAVAVVSEYDAENDIIKCISAETVATDLIRMVYEQKILEKTRARSDENDNRIMNF